MSLISHAEQYVFHLLERFCQNYPYHNPDHTRAVHSRAKYLAEKEWIQGEWLEDLELATLFHDTGFTEQYDKNEYYGSRIARKWLLEKGHPEKRIETIEHIIMATVLFSRPHSILEEIIQDADLENLGQTLEFQYSQNYYRELREYGKIDLSEKVFWQFVETLLKKFEFHTPTAQRENSEQKKKNLALVDAYLTAMGYDIPSVWVEKITEI